jgi:hypothetical protein
MANSSTVSRVMLTGSDNALSPLISVCCYLVPMTKLSNYGTYKNHLYLLISVNINQRFFHVNLHPMGLVWQEQLLMELSRYGIHDLINWYNIIMHMMGQLIRFVFILWDVIWHQYQMIIRLRFGVWKKGHFNGHYMDIRVRLSVWILVRREIILQRGVQIN